MEFEKDRKDQNQKLHEIKDELSKNYESKISFEKSRIQSTTEE